MVETKNAGAVTSVSWEEVRKHNTAKDCWLVLDGKVYDVTSFAKRHPGGKIITYYAGEDASDVFEAMHPDREHSIKFLASCVCKGDVQGQPKPSPLLAEYRQLLTQFKAEGQFNPRPLFYILHFGHILALEALAVLCVAYFGAASWLGFLLAALCLTTSQAQAGWLQHDYGHMSVFRNLRRGSVIDHLVHRIVIGTMKGASSTWWNWRHYNHHAKPNVLHKDFDIAAPYIFILGKQPSEEWGKKKRGFMPYKLQHRYWYLIGPPLLLPTYFHMENVFFCFKRGEWLDLAWTGSYYLRFFCLFVPYLGVLDAWKLYFFFRMIESHWFVWVTQMSHLPMEIMKDEQREWPALQVLATCNAEMGYFNDWFCGGLNFQIEHHLFPTMPRHNYPVVHPRVRALFDKHGVDFEVKTLWQAFADVPRCMKEYGALWADAYYS